MSSAMRELRELLEGGEVYADRISAEARRALHVPDPLEAPVAQALSSGRSVLLTGNAGDGKSHLAQTVLAGCDRPVVALTQQRPQAHALTAADVLFIRDASALTDEEVSAGVAAAQAVGASLLVTVNEGPLESLAGLEPWFTRARDAVRARAHGVLVADDERLLIVNLAGRQLAEAGFVEAALGRLLPTVGPCRHCGTRRPCPRVVSAQLLAACEPAQERLAALFGMRAAAGRHLSAREIWTALIELFFGWVCPARGDEAARRRGYVWHRLFSEDRGLLGELGHSLDPAYLTMPHLDAALWSGRGQWLTQSPPPLTSPERVAADSAEEALVLHAEWKRAWFLFGHGDPLGLLDAAPAQQFRQLTHDALAQSEQALRSLVARINRYRMGERDAERLLVSRSHSFASHRQPQVMAAAGHAELHELRLTVPHRFEATAYPAAGFRADRLLLAWRSGGRRQLAVDFATWRRLGERRPRTLQRAHGQLDLALEHFMAGAPQRDVLAHSVQMYDHAQRRKTTVVLPPPEAA